MESETNIDNLKPLNLVIRQWFYIYKNSTLFLIDDNFYIEYFLRFFFVCRMFQDKTEYLGHAEKIWEIIGNWK